MKTIQIFLQAIKNKILVVFKITQQLPLSHLLSIALYKIQKTFGIVRLWEYGKKEEIPVNLLRFDIDVDSISNADQIKIITEADQILAGTITLFGVLKQELRFPNQQNAKHWSTFYGDQFEGKDIKFTWEPARFSWAIKLAQAFLISKDEKYAEFLWKKIEEFFSINPAFLGVQYFSAQEVAMRIINLSYCVSILRDAKSTTKERLRLFSSMVETHTFRIPSTLSYSKAQNNNHLLSEAVGLYTAGIILKDHSKAKRWQKLGLKTFEYAIQHQIAVDGAYSQHSVRYHRLMLELVNWMFVVCLFSEDNISDKSMKLIKNSVIWLSSLCNPDNGKCPNLGPNDGAYLMPFSTAEYDDYRPVLQLSSFLFLNMSLYNNKESFSNLQWLAFNQDKLELKNEFYSFQNKNVIHGIQSYAYFRVEKFTNRPGHADQFHFDLWYKGINVLLDAGTFSYNSNSPWNNPLSNTFYHNIVSVEYSNQMTRGGKFLWLDWANAIKTEKYTDQVGKIRSISSEHHGYAKYNVIHQRIIDVQQNDWLIKDTLFKKSEKKEDQVNVGYHLLIKNPLSYQINDNQIVFQYDGFQMIMTIIGFSNEKISLIKGGEQIFGERVEKELECYGWFSPTYGYKEEAISLLIEDSLRIPTEILTKIRFE